MIEHTPDKQRDVTTTGPWATDTPEKRRDEIGYVPKDDPRLNTIIGPPRLPDKRREET